MNLLCSLPLICRYLASSLTLLTPSSILPRRRSITPPLVSPPVLLLMRDSALLMEAALMFLCRRWVRSWRVLLRFPLTACLTLLTEFPFAALNGPLTARLDRTKRILRATRLDALIPSATLSLSLTGTSLLILLLATCMAFIRLHNVAGPFLVLVKLLIRHMGMASALLLTLGCSDTAAPSLPIIFMVGIGPPPLKFPVTWNPLCRPMLL